MYEALQVLAAFIAADAIAGLYHLVTDLGWNVPCQVEFFRNHHERPWTMTFDWQPILAGLPLVAIGCFVWPWFLIPLGIFIAAAQVPHYYVHHTENVPRWIQWLQKYKIIISKVSHDTHHYGEGKFDTNFCVFTGWNDWWLSPFGKWAQRFKL